MLALGDSITNGGGELQWGVALQSWAMWTARALGMPYSGYADDGARARDVVDVQIPAVLERTADRAGRYDLGCLYIGVNDVRAPDWDPDGFATDHGRALAFLDERCDRVLTVTAPLRLGVPGAGAKVAQLNAIIEREATARGARLVDLRAFGARNHVMVDRVHPTALGQVAIAERALAVLGADGLPARVSPASLFVVSPTRWGRLRGDWTYAYRSAKVRVRAGLRPR